MEEPDIFEPVPKASDDSGGLIQDPGPSHRSITSYGIEIDTNKIKTASIAEEKDELADLGVNAYQQEDFENAIINQVDEAISAEERSFVRSAVSRTLQDIDADLSCVDREMKVIEEEISTLRPLDDYETKLRLATLKRQRVNKEKQKQRLTSRQSYALKQLQDLMQQSSSTGENAAEESPAMLTTGNNVQENETVVDQSLLMPISSTSSNSTESGTPQLPHNSVTKSSTEKRHLVVSSDDDDDYQPRYVDWVDSSEESNEEYGGTGKKRSKSHPHVPMRKYNKRQTGASQRGKGKRLGSSAADDGNREVYKDRIRLWKSQQTNSSCDLAEGDLDDSVPVLPDDNGGPDVVVDGNFIIPEEMWSKLFKYQQAGVKWLVELHKQNVGGIIGDEMGLGKTIQLIALLTCLQYSYNKKHRRERLGPVMIVCPTTVLHQWVKEFHKWWPEFRVAVLHDTGSYKGSREELVADIFKDNGILVTSFSNVRLQKDLLLQYRWHYVILDEGHKIRNPDAEITLSCKQFATPHRLILSGSPLQNNLKELWSLFDFVFPGRLGTLPVFMTEFSVPITMGGYANATAVQVQTAYKCACVLRDTISPYLLRRMKKDVNSSICLPTKNEQVLFCRLTDEQEQQYKKYLASDQVAAILTGRMKIFPGLIMLRKICNHPDLSTPAGSLDFAKEQQQQQLASGLDSDPSMQAGSAVYGHWRRSGKLVVVEALLRLWREQDHRVLLFSQTRQMLDILETFAQLKKYSYLRMDGTVSISSRQPAIDKFNEDKSIFLFLLTTRVGGLGINLTGANRVIIYDPDWNPSTDMQARERAWRIGQERHVTIYRLLTTGTIEEKIYHRQIFKQFLTNRILTNPFQRRFFKSNDLYELFSYGDDSKREQTETGAIFAGTGSEIKLRKTKATKRKKFRKTTTSESHLHDEDNLSQSCGRKDSKVTEQTIVTKKRRRDAVLDGVKIKNLDGLSTGTRGHSSDALSNSQQHKQQDDDILKSLFRQSGIHSALKHDRIVESSTADYVLVEKEAEKVAKQAAAALRNSRRDVRRSEVGSVTWTGLQGVSGMPTIRKKPKFGKNLPSATEPAVSSPATNQERSAVAFSGKELYGNRDEDLSSQSLLARMRNRNYFKLSRGQDASHGCEASTEYDGLMRDMRTFVSHQAQSRGQATTQEILAKFKSRVGSGKSTIFREMLKEICDLKRSKNGGLWVLKEEFT